MWYACMPSAAIMFVALSLPHILTYFENKYILGNVYRRYLGNRYDIQLYVRDMRLGNGDAYNQLGLDSLSDEDDKQ